MATEHIVTERVTVRTFFGGQGVGRVFQFIDNATDDVLNLSEETVLLTIRDNHLGRRNR